MNHEENRLNLHMTKTEYIEQILVEHGNLSCREIVEMTGWSQNLISGLLTRLKGMKRVVNKGGTWKVVSIRSTSDIDILERLHDVTDESLNNPWSEGYLSALADYGVINEQSFDKLMEYIKKH